MELTVFVTRIAVCFILSVLIGIERQYRHRMVGLRTNVLVSLGAFMFMCVSFGVNTSDQTRIAAQIVSGIGFLGAGVILRDGNKIKGLNTAATLWCVAAIGVLTASGLLIESIVCTLLVLFSNILLRLISQKIMERVKKQQTEECIIKISCTKESESIIRNILMNLIERNILTLTNLEKNEITVNEVKLKAIIHTSRIECIQDIVNKLSMETGIVSISWTHDKNMKSDNEDDNEEIDDD